MMFGFGGCTSLFVVVCFLSSCLVASEDTSSSISEVAPKNGAQNNEQSIMAFNSFWFHYEVIGFILEFANNNHLKVDLVQEVPDAGWDELYSSKFQYTSMKAIPEKPRYSEYKMVFLLTDDDMGFPDKLVDNRTVCLDHYYKNRRPNVAHHVPIKPFPGKHEGIDWVPFVLPTWRYVTKEQKLSILNGLQLKKQKPVISFIGNGHPKSPELIKQAVKNYQDFEIRIIAHKIPRANWANSEEKHNMTVTFHQSVSGFEMFELLGSSNYVGFLDHNHEKHGEGRSITSSIPNGMTAGCTLILPKKMNTWLNLQSALLLEEGQPMQLPTLVEEMNYDDVFEEREKLIQMRDKQLMAFID